MILRNSKSNRFYFHVVVLLLPLHCITHTQTHPCSSLLPKRYLSYCSMSYLLNTFTAWCQGYLDMIHPIPQSKETKIKARNGNKKIKYSPANSIPLSPYPPFPQLLRLHPTHRCTRLPPQRPRCPSLPRQDHGNHRNNLHHRRPDLPHVRRRWPTQRA